MTPSAAERDELLKGFARALFKNDMNALYRIVTPDFLWSFHDGLGVTKALAGPAAIQGHLAEQKARFAEQRFHEINLPSCRRDHLHDVPRQRDRA
jgi:hypothetical protein